MILQALNNNQEVIKNFKTFEEMFNFIKIYNFFQIIYRKDFYSNSIIYKENNGNSDRF